MKTRGEWDMAVKGHIYRPRKQRLRALWQEAVFWTRRNRTFAIYCLIVSSLTTWYCLRIVSAQRYDKLLLTPKNGTEVILPSDTSSGTPRVAKITLLSGIEDLAYEKALETHREHARIHGYPMYIARETAWAGAYNKIAYLMDILLNEMFKPPEDRVEWLFYFDADSLIMNSKIPLTIFLPPADFSHVCFIGARDYNGLNAGVLFLRVSQWTLDLLTRVKPYQEIHPDQQLWFHEQTVIALLTEGDPQFQDGVLYQPKNWFNAYFTEENDAIPGRVLAHFAHQDYKWHMYEWMRMLEKDKKLKKPVYALNLNETSYPSEIDEYWATLRSARNAIISFDKNVERGASPISWGMEHDETRALAEDFNGKLEELRQAKRMMSGEPQKLRNLTVATEESNARLISKLMTYFVEHDYPPVQAGFVFGVTSPEHPGNPPAQAGKPLASTSIEAFPNVVVEVVTAVAPPVASMEPAEPIAVTPVDSKVDEADVVAPEISIIGSTSAGALPGANAVPVTLIGSTVETGSLAEGQHVLEPSHEGSADLYST